MPTRLDKRKLEEIIRTTPGKVEDALTAGAFEGQRLAVQSFGTGPAGRTYRRGRVTHVASAEPGPPNVDTGAYKNAITTEKRGQWARAITSGGVGYAFYLEFGTRKMGARPVFGPMSVRLKGALPEIFTRILRL